jgi:poly-beta-1,6-N-acetyl-D-glucosamine synthase
MKIIFFTCLFLIAYTYLFYPLILALLNSFHFLRRRIICAGGPEFPKVSLLISVCNEEKSVEEKIINCLELDYPKEMLQVIFGSDGSTDGTAGIIKRYGKEHGNIHLFEFETREGKPSTLNRIVKFAQGQILLFSDADTLLEKDTVKKIVNAFRDKSVGCVCGKIDLKSAEGAGKPENIYWRYESWIKKMESGLGMVSGATGGLYAVKKELWEDIPVNTLIDDFVISMKTAEKGFRIIYEPSALAYEEPAVSTTQEFVRRVRIGAGDFQAVILLRRLLDPFRGLISWEFWSHKVIRWCGPFLLIAVFFSNICLLDAGRIYLYAFILQAAFYLTGFLGGLSRHFIVINAALLAGFFCYVFGLQKVTWKKARKRL